MADEVARTRAALARLERGRGKRYSPAMRERIRRASASLRATGMGWQRIGAALGIPHETVRRLSVATARVNAFVPVEVTSEISSPSLVLVTPGGYRVEGLDVALVRELLQRLP